MPVGAAESDGTSHLPRSRVAGDRAVRVLVVDDHPAVRLGLEQLLDDQPGFIVVASTGTAETAVSVAEHERVDVAVVDYHLGGRNGLWVSRKLKQTERAPRVLIFSAFANDHLAASCAVVGVDGLLNKGSLGSELCDAVRAVADGRRLLPRVPQPTADLLRRRLDESEQVTFGMLIAGIGRSEVCETLKITPGELSARVISMLGKLESLPGEIGSPEPAGGALDYERLIPQRTQKGP